MSRSKVHLITRVLNKCEEMGIGYEGYLKVRRELRAKHLGYIHPRKLASMVMRRLHQMELYESKNKKRED